MTVVTHLFSLSKAQFFIGRNQKILLNSKKQYDSVEAATDNTETKTMLTESVAAIDTDDKKYDSRKKAVKRKYSAQKEKELKFSCPLIFLPNDRTSRNRSMKNYCVGASRFWAYQQRQTEITNPIASLHQIIKPMEVS